MFVTETTITRENVQETIREASKVVRKAVTAKPSDLGPHLTQQAELALRYLDVAARVLEQLNESSRER